MAAKSGKVNKYLDKMITNLLKEVNSAKNDDGKAAYSLTEKMKVVDRALKLEAIKMKADDSGYGSGFGDEPEPEDEDGSET